MARQEALVEADVLLWAREAAAFDIETAAKKLQVKPDRVESWESGARRPTLAQLRKIADVYKRPFAAFFRSTPPQRVAPITDFRLGLTGAVDSLSPSLARELRRARFRQQTALALSEETDETPPAFAMSASISDSIEKTAQQLREFVGVTLVEQKRWRAGRETFNEWRAAFETVSVLVFQTAAVEPSEMRGFSLYSEEFPVVVVNRRDAYAGRVFTLFHELAHLALRDAGMCDLGDSNPTEVYCNAVAGEALVPQIDLSKMLVGTESREDETIQQIANSYGVSQEVIWRRLLDRGQISQSEYRAKRTALRERFRQAQEEQRNRARARDSGGIAPSRDTVSLGGRQFTALVMSALRGGAITSADAAEFMGVRAKHFDSVAQELSSGTAGE